MSLSLLPATWWVRILTHVVAAGIGAFAAYAYVDKHTVDPLQKKDAQAEQKSEDTRTSVDAQSKSEAEILKEKEDATRIAVENALEDYKRKHPQGARRSCAAPPAAASVPASDPAGTGLKTSPPAYDYQVLSEDGLDTARRILGYSSAPRRGSHIDDVERRTE